jgi:hypothetical protein
LLTRVLTKSKESFSEWFSQFLCVSFSTWCSRNNSKTKHSPFFK